MILFAKLTASIEALKLLAASFVIFIILQIAEWPIERIINLNLRTA